MAPPAAPSPPLSLAEFQDVCKTASRGLLYATNFSVVLILVALILPRSSVGQVHLQNCPQGACAPHHPPPPFQVLVFAVVYPVSILWFLPWIIATILGFYVPVVEMKVPVVPNFSASAGEARVRVLWQRMGLMLTAAFVNGAYAVGYIITMAVDFLLVDAAGHLAGIDLLLLCGVQCVYLRRLNELRVRIVADQDARAEGGLWSTTA